MRGLLLKDVYLLKRNFKGLLIVLLTFGLIGWNDKSSQMMTTIIPVFTLLSVGQFNYDETSHFDSFAMTLPVTKKSYVIEKIVFGILLALTGALISACLLIIKSNFTFIPFDFILKGISLGFFASLVYLAISIPIFFKLPVQIARTYLIVLTMAISFGSAFLFEKIGLPNIGFNTLLMTLIILTIPCLVVSTSISLRFFKKKFE